MRLITDGLVSNELKDYLLSQPGIEKIETKDNSFSTELELDVNQDLASETVLQYIEVFKKGESIELLGFDKEINGEFKLLNYIIEDPCCEYCYKELIRKLFNNTNIKSAISDYNFNTSPVKLTIEYISSYNEEELKESIKNIYKEK